MRPMPMLKVRNISSWLDVAELLQVLEERRNGPAREVDDRVQCRVGRMRGRFSVMPPPVMWAMPRTMPARGELLDDGEVAAVGAHQGRAGLVLELVDVLVRAVACDLEEQLAGQRVAVGVQAVRGQADEDVADLDVLRR